MQKLDAMTVAEILSFMAARGNRRGLAALISIPLAYELIAHEIRELEVKRLSGDA